MWWKRLNGPWDYVIAYRQLTAHTVVAQEDREQLDILCVDGLTDQKSR